MTDDDPLSPLPELQNSVTVGNITVTQLDWWNDHSGRVQ